MSDEQLIHTPGVFGETGNFLLERELGRGGMGGVYMGRDKMLDRPVAVKVMLKEYGADPEFVEKFKKEAQAVARLIHPNISQVYSYGIADGMPYIAMELVAGASLDQLMKNAPGKTDIPRIMKIGEQVAQALRCAADQGLVHGDVKPENVLLDPNGNAKLVDFGLAAMQKDTDEVWGTPYYIAPEKVKKEPVDYRADMYSLGGTLYHALTGVAPFEGDDAAAVVRKRFEGAPKKPSEIRPEISSQIDALIMKMLAMKASDRFPSFEALLTQYRKVLATGLVAGADADQDSGGGRRLGTRFKIKAHDTQPDLGSTGKEVTGKMVTGKMVTGRMSDAAQEEEGGGVGAKVAMVIGGTIGLIGLVAGLLVWYTASDRQSRAREQQEQIDRGFRQSREAISGARERALKFTDEFDSFAQKAVFACENPTEQLRKALKEHVSADVLRSLKPGPTQELLDAIASTNIVEKVEASAATNATATAETAAPAAVAQPVARRAANLPRFRDPTGDEADPMSPEHEDYLKEKAKWEQEQAAKAEQDAATPVTPVTPKPAEAVTPKVGAETGSVEALDAEMNQVIDSVVRDLNDLWGRAYGCQAAAIIIRSRITKLVAKIDEFKCEGSDKAALDRAAEFSRLVVDEFDQIKASEEVTKVQKGIGYIKAKGEKSVKQVSNRIYVIVRERERELERIRLKKLEEERLAKLAKEKEETIAADNVRIKDKYNSLVTTRVFKQLDWAMAIRQLETLRGDFKYSESQQVADGLILRVKMMQLVQECIIVNAKGYRFMRSKLAGYTINDLNEKEIQLIKPDGKTPFKMSWVKFYQTYHGNLNELLIKYIEKGKNVSKISTGRLNLQRWTEAMMGAALTMRVICDDDPAAAVRGEQIAKDAVKEFPDYLNHAKAIFPDINFDNIPQE